MKTTNAMQLKAKIKAKAKSLNVSPQLLLQDYLLECLLKRISKSDWRASIVIKGGLLISSLVGVETRVTKDLDTTIQGFPLTHESAERAFRDICAIESDDDIDFVFVRTDDIRETGEYPGIRVFLEAEYPPMSVPLSVDVTTGDAIVPAAICYSYPLMFDERSIPLMAYPVQTCLAEKLEAVISRGITTTRPRDYYDIVMLWKTRGDGVERPVLRAAIEATAAKRGALEAMGSYRDIMQSVVDDATMQARWKKYTSEYSYAAKLTLEEACGTVVEIMDAVDW